MLQDKVRTVKNRTFEKRKHMDSVTFQRTDIGEITEKMHP
jgi:hypothetical protein